MVQCTHTWPSYDAGLLLLLQGLSYLGQSLEIDKCARVVHYSYCYACNYYKEYNIIITPLNLTSIHTVTIMKSVHEHVS